MADLKCYEYEIKVITFEDFTNLAFNKIQFQHKDH